MKIEEIKDRRDFLCEQKERLETKLSEYLDENKELINTYTKNVDYSCNINNLDVYVEYRRDKIIANCNLMLKMILESNLCYSKMKIFSDKINSLIVIKHIFELFNPRENLTKATANLKNYIELNINNGNVKVNDKTLMIDFNLKQYKEIECLFDKPFVMFIDPYDLGVDVAGGKCNFILDAIKILNKLTIPKLMELSSYDYYQTYGYSEILSDELPMELFKVIENTVESLDKERICLTLNYLFLIAPPLIKSFEVGKYKKLPYFYFMEWTLNK
ncbi:hypothetical protein A0H76_1651 [Hepatospora eriocheir]|uniref:Uncharacterized protein n=1 Tax=Hepatospora eriocheir TaxID=1081669 RepID=A0A1X0QGQ3_9MICR|nr:hypothetical protein A0H76_1651 [Hepatospora eriocheir]